MALAIWVAWGRARSASPVDRNDRVSRLLAAMFLLALPLVGTFGTRNPLPINLIMQMAPVLAPLEIRFSDDYVLCGKVSSYRLWKPNANSAGAVDR